MDLFAIRRRNLLTVTLFAVLAISLTLAGCGGGNNADADKIPKDTLVVGIADDVDVLDPGVSSTNSSWAVSYYAYERLMEYDGASTDVKLGLAKDYSVTDDGLVWTFTLRDNAKFDDGTPVTAEAVKYTFDRLKAIGKGPWDSFPTLDKVAVEDTHKVKFTLSSPFPAFLSTLATNAGSIVNPKVQEHETGGDWGQAWLSENTAGSGPYMLQEWVKDQYHKLVLNPNYGGDKPAIKEAMFKIVKDPSARRLQVEKGDLDIAIELPIDQMEQMKDVEGLSIKEYPSLSVCCVYMNNQKAPLNNVKFRQALSYATDYAGIIDGVQLDHAKQMVGPVPEGMWGQKKDIFTYSYDLEKAQQLIQESGVQTPVTLKYLYADRSPDWEPIGLALQASFDKIGVKLEMEKLAYSSMREKLDSGDFDLAIGNWSPDYADPYMFMSYWFDSDNWGLAGNRSFYKNDQVDQLIRDAVATPEKDERTELYDQAQEIIGQEAAYIYLYQRNYMLAVRDNVVGYTFNAMLVDMFNFPTISKK